MKNIAPCKGCTDRTVGCHSVCKLYATYKEEKTNEFIETRKTVCDERLMDAYKVKVIRRIRKKISRR
jgi:hypothetical protein